MLLMWLGEQITQRGIGNGISLIIYVGIIAELPGALGQFFASIIMILGYAIIAVPTGLISVELSRAENSNTQSCPSCSKEGHDDNAKFCKYCGADLGL